jgi:hypothetical protein
MRETAFTFAPALFVPARFNLKITPFFEQF